jgi:hypothetical protein
VGFLFAVMSPVRACTIGGAAAPTSISVLDHWLSGARFA